ncbi:MBL fold metallo-hydrolase [Epibacterium ulvae]|uniref:MBL fold metallo-hydrolase n=1 Tax=Epibacterium ulvae TaxID=1156985 RepID=UPI002491B4E1|nr:MBL fold metallo-hydrolase [Epibacterium ulvae]
MSDPSTPLQVEHLEPDLRLLRCANPSPMTYTGTNTYLLGRTDIAVIDPGPDDAAHLQAILAAIRPDQRISHIIVTHSHKDHSPLAAALEQKTGAPVLAFGAADAGRSPVMKRLALQGLQDGGEGIDWEFCPTHTVKDGDTITGKDWELTVLHTPGHLGNHICLAWNEACFTADHVMGWASSLVSPPDGDLTDFMASCRRLAQCNWRIFYPGHGAPITTPNTRLNWLIEHRLTRETAIIEALTRKPMTAEALALAIYSDIDAKLLPAATRNVLAHLIDLYGKNRVIFSDPLSQASLFSLA